MCRLACLQAGDRFAALQPISMGLAGLYGSTAAGAARGLALRMDHGSQYLSDHFTNQIKFWGIQPSYAFVAEPQTNGVAERFGPAPYRTLKEQIIHGRIYRNIAELPDAVRDFVELSAQWIVDGERLPEPRSSSSGVARRDLNQARRVRQTCVQGTGCATMKDDTVVALRQPESFSDDPLTEILRAGARQLLGQAIEAEVAAHIEAHADLTDASGRRRIVRHGHMPEREVQTGIGAVTVRRPRVRDRDPQATGGRIRFTSSILPPYLRRAKSVEALLPWLYLKGISSGDFSEALAALLGPDAPGLTASTIGRLKAVWWDEYEAWQKRDLSARRYVYFWADGVYFSPRMDHDKQCVLVIIGADAMGNKDIVGMVDGYRESAQSWKELLLDLKRRGLETGPELAVGDGALGFWKALREVYGETRVQRCWVHKTANVLNQMPKSLQAKAKGHLHDIWMAETRADAEAAFDFFIAAYGAKYHKAAERLVKDRERLLSFYDFPAEHWKHIRTTNPIESTFATVRLRTVKTKGCLSRKTALAMAFKLILSARRKWRKLDGSNQLAELVEGVPFKDGIKITKHAA